MRRYWEGIRTIFQDYLPLRKYFKDRLGGLGFGLVCLLVVDFSQLLIPLVIKKVIDALTSKFATTRLLLDYALIILAIASGMALLRFIWRHFLFGFSRYVERSLRDRLFDHILTLSPSYFQRTKTGDLMAHFINDITAVRMAAGMGLVALTDGVVMGLTAVAFMVYISPLLTLFALVPAPFIIFFTARLTRRMALGHEKVQKTFGDLTEKLREAFTGMRVVKTYDRGAWETLKVEEEGKNYIKANLDLARLLALFNPMLMVLTNIGLVIVIWLGGRLTIFHQITTGDLVAFVSYLNLLTWPVMAVGWVTSLLQRGAASMRRINRILTEEPEIRSPAAPFVFKRPEVKGRIEFKEVSYQYPDQKSKALDHVSLNISGGQTAAFVGRVGCGKTTLLHMLPRLLEVNTGDILIDGRDIRMLSLYDLRRSIGFISQDVFVFSDTIRNNVLFGREDIRDDQLEQALQTARFDEEVRGFKNGWETLLGERGVTLSGGQRQRLTIARALILDPPILVLDDALSMVDTRTEEMILNRVLAVRAGRTNLIVSHRLTTISRADVIIVLENGRVTEMGDHQTLLEQGVIYPQLYRKQLLVQELEM